MSPVLSVPILPVIDLLQGVAVRGVAGKRQEYRPLVSRWCSTADPLELATGLRRAFGFSRFYLADLDGILLQRPNYSLYRELSGTGLEFLIDAGVRTAADVGAVLEHGAKAVVIGLETVGGPDILQAMTARHDTEQLVFSLDLHQGVPLIAATAAWPGRDPLEIAGTVIASGIRRLIVLDLADVGMGTGGSTARLCCELRQRYPDIPLVTGGGVRGPQDVREWSHLGIAELLVASALHDGRLSPADVAPHVDHGR